MNIDAASWGRLRQAFEECLELDPELRNAHLRGSLASDPELVTEGLAMLAAHESDVLLEIEKHFLDPGPPPDSSLIGTTVGHYRIERLLGRGGMGEVYLAERRHPEFRQKVALKLLRAGVYHADAMARFRRERQILARLNHPHIAPLLDGGVAPDGRPYLVLQYVEGAPITEYCNRTAAPRQRRLELFCEVARAVEYAHRNLVVHRDLKPGNILVTEEGEVRLLDFGVAKLLDPSEDEIDDAATRQGVRLMTPDYAAPEQMEGLAITTATDIYALGIVLHELLTGARPKAAQSGGLPSDLQTVIAKALEPEPERRYPSAGEMARDAERYLAGEPILARRPSFSYRLGKLVRRNRMAAALTVLSVVLVLGFAVTATWQARRIARERDAARRQQQTAERVVSMMTDLFSESDPNRAPGGSDLPVGEFLKRIEAHGIPDRGLDPEVQARLKQVLGEVYMVRSQYAQAKPLLEEALRLLRSAKGEGDPATASAFYDLAKLLSNTDPPAKVIPLFREALARFRRLYPDKDEKVAAAMEDLGELLPATQERLDLIDASLAMRRALSPDLSAGIASSLNSLGEYYLAKENFDQAQRYFEESATAMRKLFPNGHPYTFTAMSNLAAVYSTQGRYDLSESIDRSLVDLKSRMMGPETYEVALALGNLGVDQAAKGDLAAAEQSFRRGLDLFIRLLGPDHSQVANTSRNLGCVLQYRGKFPEAVQRLADAVRIQRRNGGDEAGLLGMDSQLQVARLRTGDERDAIERLRAIEARMHELRPEGFQMLASTQVWLGEALLHAGNAADAERLFHQALEYRKRMLPAIHPRVAEAEAALGAALKAQGKPETTLARGLEIYSAWGLADPVEVRRLREWCDR